MDMTKDPFGDYAFGKVALKKINHPNPNFRLFKAGWLGNTDQREVMQVTGAVFREVKRGPRKGQLGLAVPKTNVSTTVHISEIKRMEKKMSKEERHEQTPE